MTRDVSSQWNDQRLSQVCLGFLHVECHSVTLCYFAANVSFSKARILGARLDNSRQQPRGRESRWRQSFAPNTPCQPFDAVRMNNNFTCKIRKQRHSAPLEALKIQGITFVTFASDIKFCQRCNKVAIKGNSMLGCIACTTFMGFHKTLVRQHYYRTHSIVLVLKPH